MRRVVLILLALTVFVPSISRAATFYRCGHDGELRDQCCCAPKHDQHEEHEASLRRGCCCQVVHVTSAAGPEREQSADTSAAPACLLPPLPVIAVAPAQIPDLRVEWVWTGAGPPSPLFVVHCALLL